MLSLQDGRIRAFNPSQGGAAFEILLHRTTHPRTRTNKRSSE
jgi:hypothetical protein